MKREEFTEGNKLIAEFMEIPKCDRCADCGQYKYGAGIFYSPEEMPYHSNWSWLMDVVEKIGKEYPIRITWLPNSMEVTYIDRDEYSTDDSIADYGGHGALVNTYLCVVDFIKWHNQKFKKKKN